MSDHMPAVGDRVTVQLTGEVSTLDTYAVTVRDSAGREATIPHLFEGRVYQAVPQHWPPRPGDLWADRDGDPWFAVDEEDGIHLIDTSGAPEGPDRVLEMFGPLRLDRRKGWTATSPAVQPKPELCVMPGDQEHDHEMCRDVEAERQEDEEPRTALVRDLRELAQWLEDHPEFEVGHSNGHVSVLADSVDEVRSAAEVMGVQVTTIPDRRSKKHWGADVEFGRVGLRVFHIETQPVDEQPGGAS